MIKYRSHVLYVLIKWLKLKVNTYHEMELLLLFHSRFFFLPYSLDAISEKVCQYVQYIVWERILNSSIESIVGIVSELFVN